VSTRIVDAVQAGMGETLRNIYDRADAHGISRAAAARLLVEERLNVVPGVSS
jgi:hypothetical protein